MDWMNLFSLLVWGSLLPFVLPGTRYKAIGAAAVIAAGAVMAAVAGVTAIVLPGSETGTGAWLPGLDPIGGVFALAVAISGVACAVYAVGYMPGHAAGKSHTQVALHFAALVALFYAMIEVIRAEDT